MDDVEAKLVMSSARVFRTSREVCRLHCLNHIATTSEATTMLSAMHRCVFRRRTGMLLLSRSRVALLHASATRAQKSYGDPRLKEVDRADNDLIEDQFAVLRPKYEVPKNPIILAHGLLGFDELHIAGQNLPGLHYWRGITEALAGKGVEVITATVPPSGSIEKRAAKLAESIERKAHGKAVNIIA